MLGLELKDIIGVIIIPLVAAAITALWPIRETMYKREQFEKLIVRELSEAFPQPDHKDKVHNGTWMQHVDKDFIHKRIFQDPSGSSDLLLSLDENVAYAVGQLWDAHAKGDATRWISYIGFLEERYQRRYRCLRGLKKEWSALLAQYGALKDQAGSPSRVA